RAYRGVEYLEGFAGSGFAVIRFMGSAAGDLLGIFGEGGLWGVGLFRLAMHDRVVAASRQRGRNSGIMVVDWANLSSEYFRMRVALRDAR
ncbi:MAG: hypothetical protein ACOYOZ_16885, partial [Pirellula sp.]